jgi:Na+-transporting NADH:ubiquinone oxidoreductase subunit NqrB
MKVLDSADAIAGPPEPLRDAPPPARALEYPGDAASRRSTFGMWSAPARIPAWPWRLDPRLYQIATLASLLTYGVFWLHLEIAPAQAMAILITVVLAQLVADALGGRLRADPLSALISGLSLCLLLRTDSLLLCVLTAIAAVASKFVFRVNGKHVFNPTNFALVLMMLATDRVWVSPVQWGSLAVFAFLLASAGALVVSRARRADVTCAFLVSYAALIVGRSLWLGDPLSIPLHRLENGALVLFAFFMISDPKTTPDSRAGRIVFAALGAAVGYYVQFKLFRTNGLLWSLALCSLAVPLIDRVLTGPRYQWRGTGVPAQEAGPRERIRRRASAAACAAAHPERTRS